MIAAVFRARAETGQIGAGAGLGESLRPDLVGVQDARQVLRLLGVGAPVDDRRADEIEPHARQNWGARGSVFLVPDHALDDRGAAAAVLLRPRNPDPPRL